MIQDARKAEVIGNKKNKELKYGTEINTETEKPSIIRKQNQLRISRKNKAEITSSGKPTTSKTAQEVPVSASSTEIPSSTTNYAYEVTLISSLQAVIL